VNNPAALSQRTAPGRTCSSLGGFHRQNKMQHASGKADENGTERIPADNPCLLVVHGQREQGLGDVPQDRPEQDDKRDHEDEAATKS
jgi:hypothetical protein